MYLSMMPENHDAKIGQPARAVHRAVHDVPVERPEAVGARHRPADDRRVVEFVHVVLVRQDAVRAGEARLEVRRDLGAPHVEAVGDGDADDADQHREAHQGQFARVGQLRGRPRRSAGAACRRRRASRSAATSRPAAGLRRARSLRPRATAGLPSVAAPE